MFGGRGVEAECSGDADGGCAADDHVGDGVGVLLDVVEWYPVFALWERELIDDGERLGLFVPSEWADVGLCDGLHGESSFEKGKKKASLRRDWLEQRVRDSNPCYRRERPAS